MRNEDHCPKCGVARPSWLGSPHRCPKVGELYEIASFRRITAEDLEFFTAA